MVRIAGVDIPRKKRMEIALTYIFGIGRTSAKEILDNFDSYKSKFIKVISPAYKEVLAKKKGGVA